MARAATQTVIAALAGFAAALITTAVRSSSEPAPAPAAREASRARQAVRQAEHTATTRMAYRVARLESSVASRSETEPAPEPPPLTREQAMQRVRARTADRAARHDAQPVDTEWAATAKRAIRDDLAPLTTRTDLEIADIDCRTSMCRIDLSWSSYEQAQTDAGHIGGDIRSLNCAIHVPLPPPEGDDAQSYRSEVYLDCSRLRSNGA